jgi:hypothetical protein
MKLELAVDKIKKEFPNITEKELSFFKKGVKLGKQRTCESCLTTIYGDCYCEDCKEGESYEY